MDPADHRREPRPLDRGVDADSSCDEPPGRASLLSLPAARVPGAVLRVAGRVILATRAAPDGRLDVGAIGDAWGRPVARWTPSCSPSRSRSPSPACSLLVGLPAAWVFARFTFPGRAAAAGAVRRSRSCCRRWSWHRRSWPCSGRAAPSTAAGGHPWSRTRRAAPRRLRRRGRHRRRLLQRRGRVAAGGWPLGAPRPADGGGGAGAGRLARGAPSAR